jgi:hypothetical protein
MDGFKIRRGSVLADWGLVHAIRPLWIALLLLLPAALHAQDYFYVTNNGTITITDYIGSEGAVNIPDMINGLPVTCIGDNAFLFIPNLKGALVTSVTIPRSVTSIGSGAFANNNGWLFGDPSLGLNGVYFQGNAPSIAPTAFSSDIATVYYLPGTTGWDVFSTTTGVPTALWLLPNPMILSFEPDFGMQTNCFHFTISWATNIPIVVEACTDIANPVWSPVATNTLTAGSSYFSDPQWTNYPGRFYRLRSP